MLQKARTVLISGCFFFLALGALGMAQGMMNGSRGGMNGGSGATGGMTGGSGSIGGMGGSGTMGGNGGMTRSGTMGAGEGMGGTAMGMSNGAVTVSNDGKTLYVLSRVLPQAIQGVIPQDQIKTKLSAIDGKTGITNWSLVFDENWLMRPVEGPDGHLFLVALGDQLMGMSNTTTAQDQDAKLYVVDPGSHNVIKTAALPGEVASLPTIDVSGTTYLVYVESFDMGLNGATMGQIQGSDRDAVLSVFDPYGKLVNTLPLDR